MSFTEFSFVLFGIYLCISLISFSFFFGHKVLFYRDHALKVFSSLGIILLTTFIYHESLAVIIVFGLFFHLTPLFWPYSFYGSLFKMKPVSSKGSILIYGLSLCIIIISSGVLGFKNWLVIYSFCAVTYHIILLTVMLSREKQFIVSNRKEKLLQIISFGYEFAFFIILLVTALSSFLLESLAFLFVLSIIHLVLLCLALVPKFNSFLALQKETKIETEKLRQNNIEKLTENIRLEQELSLAYSQNNLALIDMPFVNLCLEKIKTSLDNEINLSSLLLIKLSKYMRNHLISNQIIEDTIQNEINSLLHYVELANLTYSAEIIELDQENLVFKNEKTIRTQVILPLIQSVVEYLRSQSNDAKLKITFRSYLEKVSIDLFLISSNSQTLNAAEIDLSKILVKLLLEGELLGDLKYIDHDRIVLNLIIQSN